MNGPDYDDNRHMYPSEADVEDAYQDITSHSADSTRDFDMDGWE